jgi:hypothetical protein
MVTRTGGRLPDPRLVTTSSGTSKPVAVFPFDTRVARKLAEGGITGENLASRLARRDEPRFQCFA